MQKQYKKIYMTDIKIKPTNPKHTILLPGEELII